MSLKRSVAATWGAHLITLVVGLYLVPFVLHQMGEEGYGAWVFVNSIAGYTWLLYLGFGPTVCRYVAHHRAKQEWGRVNQVASTIMAVYCGAAALVVLLAIGFMLAAPWLGNWGGIPIRDVQIAMLILGLSMAAGIVGSVYGAVLYATNRFDRVAVVQIVATLARLALTVAFLQREYGLVVLAAAFAAGTLLDIAITAWLAYRELPTLSVRPGLVSRAVIRECFGFSAFNGLRGIAIRLIHMSDTVVIGFALGPKAIVPYYIGSRLVQMVHQPLEKIADVVLPAAGAHHAHGEHQRLQALTCRAMAAALLLAGGLWIGAVYFGGALLKAWIGDVQPVSEQVMLILLAAQVVGQPMIVLRQVLVAMGLVRTQTYLDLAQAAINLTLSLGLLKLMGIVGVAWGTLVPLLVIEIGLLLPHGLKAVGLPLTHLLARVVAPSVLPLAVLWGYCEVIARSLPPQGWIPVVCVTAGGGAILGVTWWLCERWHGPSHEVAWTPRTTASTGGAP